MADVEIRVTKNGPYLVSGRPQLRAADGSPIAVENDTIALCRCGASSNKPFCDGTHSKIGFDAAEVAVPESAE
jgi:3-phenylpropionate/trans-cinnamate dioxygenase ferredoxin subunit